MMEEMAGGMYDVVLVEGEEHRLSTHTVHTWPYPTPAAATHLTVLKDWRAQVAG